MSAEIEHLSEELTQAGVAGRVTDGLPVGLEMAVEQNVDPLADEIAASFNRLPTEAFLTSGERPRLNERGQNLGAWLAHHVESQLSTSEQPTTYHDFSARLSQAYKAMKAGAREQRPGYEDIDLGIVRRVITSARARDKWQRNRDDEGTWAKPGSRFFKQEVASDEEDHGENPAPKEAPRVGDRKTRLALGLCVIAIITCFGLAGYCAKKAYDQGTYAYERAASPLVLPSPSPTAFSNPEATLPGPQTLLETGGLPENPPLILDAQYDGAESLWQVNQDGKIGNDSPTAGANKDLLPNANKQELPPVIDYAQPFSMKIGDIETTRPLLQPIYQTIAEAGNQFPYDRVQVIVLEDGTRVIAGHSIIADLNQVPDGRQGDFYDLAQFVKNHGLQPLIGQPVTKFQSQGDTMVETQEVIINAKVLSPKTFIADLPQTFGYSGEPDLTYIATCLTFAAKGVTSESVVLVTAPEQLFDKTVEQPVKKTSSLEQTLPGSAGDKIVWRVIFDASRDL